MWFLPLLLLGVAIVAVSNRERGQAQPPPPRDLPLPAVRPIHVLGEFVRLGQMPPPPVILCAIAEAESAGRCDVASDIVRVFVAPVVQQREQLYAPGPTRGSVRELPVPPGPSTQLWPPEANYPGFDARFGAQERLRRGEVPARMLPIPSSVQERVYAPRFNRGRGEYGAPQPTRKQAPAPTPQFQSQPTAPTIEEIQQMLDTNPEAFRQQAVAAHRADPQWAAARADGTVPHLDPVDESEIAMMNVAADAAGEERMSPQFIKNVDAITYGIAKLIADTPISDLPSEATRIFTTPLDELAAQAEAQRQSGDHHRHLAGAPAPTQPTGFASYDDWYEAIGRPSGMRLCNCGGRFVVRCGPPQQSA